MGSVSTHVRTANESGTDRADRNRSIRKEAIRDQLSAQGHLQHVIEISDKIADLTIEMDLMELGRLKTVLDTKFKIIAKYLPDLKSIEFTGDVNVNQSLEATGISNTDWQMVREIKQRLDANYTDSRAGVVASQELPLATTGRPTDSGV